MSSNNLVNQLRPIWEGVAKNMQNQILKQQILQLFQKNKKHYSIELVLQKPLLIPQFQSQMISFSESEGILKTISISPRMAPKNKMFLIQNINKIHHAILNPFLLVKGYFSSKFQFEKKQNPQEDSNNLSNIQQNNQRTNIDQQNLRTSIQEQQQVNLQIQNDKEQQQQFGNNNETQMKDRQTFKKQNQLLSTSSEIKNQSQSESQSQPLLSIDFFEKSISQNNIKISLQPQFQSLFLEDNKTYFKRTCSLKLDEHQ